MREEADRDKDKGRISKDSTLTENTTEASGGTPEPKILSTSGLFPSGFQVHPLLRGGGRKENFSTRLSCCSGTRLVDNAIEGQGNLVITRVYDPPT